MECGKDLAEGEKVLAIKEITKIKTNKSIAERMNRCVMTEIGESVRIFSEKSFKEETSVWSRWFELNFNAWYESIEKKRGQNAWSNKRNNF